MELEEIFLCSGQAVREPIGLMCSPSGMVLVSYVGLVGLGSYVFQHHISFYDR